MTDSTTSGVLYVVATPIGNLEDMTYRAVRVLAEADVVAAEDTRKAKVLFQRFDLRPDSVRSMFTGNEAMRAEELVGELLAGKNVAAISDAGMPGVSDPGQRLVAAAIAAGVKVVVIPGPSAAVTALVGSGLDSGQFRFVGFPPRTSGARRQLFGTLRSDVASQILYEAPSRVGETLADLRDAMGEERRAVVARELTKMFEEYARGTLGSLAERYRETAPRGECTIVVAGGSGEGAVVDVEAEIAAMLAEGMGAKDIAARLVVKTGKPRRDLYQLVLSVQRGDTR